jgi:hypothetical protein
MPNLRTCDTRRLEETSALREQFSVDDSLLSLRLNGTTALHCDCARAEPDAKRTGCWTTCRTTFPSLVAGT